MRLNGGMDECRLRREIGNAQEISRKLSGNFFGVQINKTKRDNSVSF